MPVQTIRAGLVALLLAAQPAVAGMINVDNAELAQLAEDGVPVIDVRTPAEWQATGVVEGSHLLTFFDASGNYDAQAWLTALDQIAPDGQPVALICARGSRTATISRFLTEQVSREGVHNVTGGINAWIGAGRPTVAPSQN